jgi:uncharacterized membrane protein
MIKKSNITLTVILVSSIVISKILINYFEFSLEKSFGISSFYAFIFFLVLSVIIFVSSRYISKRIDNKH